MIQDDSVAYDSVPSRGVNVVLPAKQHPKSIDLENTGASDKVLYYEIGAKMVTYWSRRFIAHFPTSGVRLYSHMNQKSGPSNSESRDLETKVATDISRLAFDLGT